MRRDYCLMREKMTILLSIVCLDSDENLKFTWGDLGRIYFFIHEDDLSNHDFSNVRVVGDCY